MFGSFIVLEENHLPSVPVTFLNSQDCFFPEGQSEVNHGLVGGPPDQDPIIASHNLRTRTQVQTPLGCDQEED